MKNGRARRILGIWVAAAFVAACMSPPMRAFEDLPESVHLKSGAEAELQFSLPGVAEITSPNEAVIAGFDQSVTEMGNEVTITAGSHSGEATVTYRLLGLIPVKQVSVTVDEERRLIPGGQSVGVAIRTEGVVVVGSSDLGSVASPARLAGLRAGDRILSVNGVAVTGAQHLTELVSDGNEAEFEIERDGERQMIAFSPALDGRDNAYRLGVWVRDSTAGIGTLTFYDPQQKTFGALGHAITDVDTGIVLPVGEGGIYESSVVDVNKGKSGQPGELLGQFFDAETMLGEVKENTDYGIFGNAEQEISNPLYPEGLPVGTRADVSLGKAELLTTLVDGEIRSYEIEIVKLADQSEAATRSMVIRVTDEELLEKTGGIVQGMSGSPIIQNGRIIGAVTHVFVNDPTQGYGVYLDWMLEQIPEEGEEWGVSAA